MVFEGEEAFAYDINTVWSAMHNVDLLTKALPGCKSMTAIGENLYVVTLSLGVAAVKGEYEGKVKITDVKIPSHYVIEGDGTGAPGFVNLRMDCRFEPQGSGVSMKWKCDAAVGGVIASVGGKVLFGISKFLAKQFFKAFKDELDNLSLSTDGDAKKPTLSESGCARPRPRTVGRASQNWFIRIWRSVWQRFSRQ